MVCGDTNRDAITNTGIGTNTVKNIDTNTDTNAMLECHSSGVGIFLIMCTYISECKEQAIAWY